MKISILIANKNYAEYLGEAIDSALAQDYTNVEVIVVDDGSTDRSIQLMAEYGKRIVAISGDYEGQLAATNVAFERCSGDVILMLDSDDKLRTDAASIFANTLANDDYIKASGYLKVVDSEGRDVGFNIPRRLTPTGTHRDSVIANGPGAYRASFNSGNAWTRGFLEQVLPFPQDCKLGPDGYLNLICPLFGATASIDQWVAEYRIHDRNTGPVSRRFTLPWLKRVHAQIEASSIYLNDWIGKTGGHSNAMDGWRRSWRSRLVGHCLFLMTRQRQYHESICSLVFSPLNSVGTRTKVAILLMPVLLLVRCLPRSMALSIAGRLLGFSKIKDEIESRQI